MVKQSISDAARAYLEQKDNDTFAELYNAAKDTLYFHIYEKVKNRDIAEDLLQDTWMKILRSIDQLKSPDAFLSWAVTAANNTALDYLKNQTEKRHNAALSVTPSDGEGDNEDVLLNLVDDKLMLPENVMENEVLLKLVMDKLNTLSESQRKILYESAVNEKTDQAIASELGMNPNTVKTTRRRAIQQFNKAMAGLADSRGLKLVPVIGAAAFLYLFKNDAHAMEHASADSIWQRFQASPVSKASPDSNASPMSNASPAQENATGHLEPVSAETAKDSASDTEAAAGQASSGDAKTQSSESHVSPDEKPSSADSNGTRETEDASVKQESSDANQTRKEGSASSGAAEENVPSVNMDSGTAKSTAAIHSAGQSVVHTAGLLKSVAAVVIAGAAVTTGILYNTGKLQAFALKSASPKQEEASALLDTDLTEDTADTAISEASAEPATGEETAADTEVSSDNADTAVTEASAAPTEEDTSDTKEETAELSKVTADVDIINGALNTTQSYTPIFDVMSYAEHLNWFLYGGFDTLKERTRTTTYTNSDSVRNEHSTYKYDGPVKPGDGSCRIDETKTVRDPNGESTTTIEMEFSKPYTLDNYAPADNYYEPIAQFFPDRVFDGKEVIRGGHVTTPLGLDGDGPLGLKNGGGQAMGSIPIYDVTYTYDDDGRLSSWIANLNNPVTIQVSYENGFPVAFTDADGDGWKLSYDDTGRLFSAAYTSAEFQQKYSFSYESKGRLSSWDMTESADYNNGFDAVSGETKKVHTDFTYSD